MKTSDQIQAGMYVDGQLGQRDERKAVEAMCEDPLLQREIDEIQDLKTLMRNAYPLPEQQSPVVTTRSRRWLGWVASAAAIVLAFVLGVLLPGKYLPGEVGAHAIAVGDGSSPVILHVPENSPAKWSEALDVAQALEARQVKVEVLANSYGVNLLTAAHSPYAQRIRALLKEYPELAFVACATSLKKLRDEGINARLIDGVGTTPSAVEHVADKVAKGWHYIKI